MAGLPVWNAVLPYLDGNWFDICSLFGGIFYAVYRAKRSVKRHKIISKDTGIDVANGVGLFPLAVLAIASFSSSALMALLSSNRLILSVAGVVALLAILEE